MPSCELQPGKAAHPRQTSVYWSAGHRTWTLSWKFLAKLSKETSLMISSSTPCCQRCPSHLKTTSYPAPLHSLFVLCCPPRCTFPGHSRAPMGKAHTSRQDFEPFHPFPAHAWEGGWQQQQQGSPTDLPSHLSPSLSLHPIPQGFGFYLTSRFLAHCPQVPTAVITQPGSIA